VSVKLPSYEEIKELIKKEVGLDDAQIEKEIERVREKYQGFIKTKDMCAFLLAKELNVELKLETVAPSTKRASFKAVLEGNIDSNFDLEGVIGGMSHLQTSKGVNVLAFTLVDPSGCIEGRAYGESVIKQWEDQNIKFGDAVLLKNVKLFRTPKNETIITMHSWSGVDKLDKNVDINQMTKDAAEDYIGDGEFTKVAGVCVDVRHSPYVGCPTCKVKAPVDVKEGDRYTCERCKAEVSAVTYTWKRAIITDGSSQVCASFNPSFLNMSMESVGMPMKIYGIYNAQRKEIDVTYYEVVGSEEKLVKPYEDYFKPQPQPQQEPEKSTAPKEPEPQPESPKKVKPQRVEELKRAVVELVKTYETLPKKAPAMLLKAKNSDLTEEDANNIVQSLISEGVLIEENGKLKLRAE